MSTTNLGPRDAVGRAPLVPNLVAGVLVALVTLSYSISYAALIFSGTGLEYHQSAGIHMALMTAWLVALAVAIGSCFEFAIGGPDSNATAILALMAGSLGARLVHNKATPDEIKATVLVMLGASAVLVGVVVYLIGAVRRGRLIRFLPYPVVGGFLAGTGYLIFAGGFKVLVGQPLAWATLCALPPVPPTAWLVTILVAVCLLVLPRFCKHFLVMPAVLVAGVALFYVGLRLSDIDIAAARDKAMLFQPLPAGRPQLPPLLTQALWTDVRWAALLAEWQNLFAMVVVVIITILLNATGLDLATQHDVDFDRELRVNGFASALSGLCGGMAGYLSVSRSLLNFKAGARLRASGLCAAAACLGATFLFTPAVAYLPRPVLAALLIYLGFSMLWEWVWDTFFKLPFLEYALLAAILLLIVLQGLIAGVAFGLLVASVFFVYSYSRTSCIKHCFASNTHFSNKERSLQQTAQLKEVGKAARALSLQGYLFFGTSSAIVETCRELIERENVRFLLLDFRLVQGLDASAVLSFNKLEQIGAAHDVCLLFSGLHPETRAVLEQTKFLPKPAIRIFADMDHGLEWVEDGLLAEAAAAPPAAGGQGLPLPRLDATAIIAEMDLRRILSAEFKPAELDVLIGYCETLKLQAGAALFRKGDPGDSLYFIERGDVSVLLRLEDGESLRLRSFGPGTIVGEMGLYSKQPRSADVVADGSCRVRKLGAENLTRLEREHPEVAIQFHTFVIRLLSARLAAANEEIRALL